MRGPENPVIMIVSHRSLTTNFLDVETYMKPCIVEDSINSMAVLLTIFHMLVYSDSGTGRVRCPKHHQGRGAHFVGAIFGHPYILYNPHGPHPVYFIACTK